MFCNGVAGYVNLRSFPRTQRLELANRVHKALGGHRRCYGDSPYHAIESEFSNIAKFLKDDACSFAVPLLHDIMQICVHRRSIGRGKSCHALAIQVGLLMDTTTCNILINLYSKCGQVDFARKVFDRMPLRSAVSWNTMIAAYNQQGERTQALLLFMEMHRGNTSVTEFTLSSVICACAAESAVVESKQLHAMAVKMAMDSNVYVGTAVLDVYAKCNMIGDARRLFEKMTERSPVTWSSILAGYMQNNLPEESLALFLEAQISGVEVTQFTLSAVLAACASLAATIEGTQVHALSLKTSFDSNIYVATALIHVYSKCGLIEEAYTVFKCMEEKSLVLWNAVIAGFSKHARIYEVMLLFEKMQQSGLWPNEITYVSLLSACGHVGWVEIGRRYYNEMLKDPNVQPNALHYSCMVDVLGRGGNVDEAWKLIETMPFQATASMWGSLLASCRKHCRQDLAKEAADRLFVMEPDNGGSHILLSNIYAANKQWNEVAMARKFLKDSGAKKEVGRSWIEADRTINTFVVGERNHPKIVQIYRKLDELEKEMGALMYMVGTEHDLHDVGESQKEELLRHHSERLALAFGLISLPSGNPIRIFKNLRICGDCHSFMKFASRITYRKIIIRDANRFHHFNCGSCSCCDFW